MLNFHLLIIIQEVQKVIQFNDLKVLQGFLKSWCSLG